jgi:hypothetical protein
MRPRACEHRIEIGTERFMRQIRADVDELHAGSRCPKARDYAE